MAVLKVNVGDEVTPDWHKIGCGDGVSAGRLKLWIGSQWAREACDDDVDYTWLQYKTITPVFGTNSITFDTPLTLDPFIEYWFVMDGCAQSAQAEGTSDGIFTNLLPVSVPPGGLYPIFTSTASSGTAPSITYGGAPDNYWGAPTSIGQSFEVTSSVTITGLSAYWGSPTFTGRWGIARSIIKRPLKMWDGTAWQVVACMVSVDPPRPENFALGASYTISGTYAGSPNNDDGVKLTDGLRATNYNDGHNVGFQNNNPTVTVDLGAAQTVAQYRHRGTEYSAFGIYRVASFAVSHSSDGVTWSSPETFTDPATSAVGDTPYSILFTLATPVSARYWRIAMTRGGEWTFVGEVELLATS